MSESVTKPVYLVDVYSDPVVVRIDGRACFQNSACLRDFITEMLRQGMLCFVLDFQSCASMDSTFLGCWPAPRSNCAIRCPSAASRLARVGQRNLELIRNLGLHRLLTVDAGDFSMSFNKCDTALLCANKTKLQHARLVLEAHENLVSVDEANRAKFQDVLSFMKDRVEQK